MRRTRKNGGRRRRSRKRMKKNRRVSRKRTRGGKRRLGKRSRKRRSRKRRRSRRRYSSGGMFGAHGNTSALYSSGSVTDGNKAVDKGAAGKDAYKGYLGSKATAKTAVKQQKAADGK